MAAVEAATVAEATETSKVETSSVVSVAVAEVDTVVAVVSGAAAAKVHFMVIAAAGQAG